MEATITSAEYSCSFHCFIQKMLALATVVTSYGLLSMFLSFPELLKCFVWEGVDTSQKEQFAIYRRNNLQFTGLFYVLLALSWAVDTDGDFCGWPQRNSSDGQEGWNVCLVTHPCTLFSCPCLLYSSDIG